MARQGPRIKPRAESIEIMALARQSGLISAGAVERFKLSVWLPAGAKG